MRKKKEGDFLPYVPVPKDLTRVKTKVAFNLTKRQLVCFSLAAVVGLPVYFLTHKAIGNTASVFLMIGLMMPFFFFAMYERDGLPAEKILKNMLQHRLRPEHRPYKTQNLYKIMSQKEGSHIAQKQTAGGAGKASATKHSTGAKKSSRGKKGR